MWKCKGCAEQIEDEFDACWNCGSDVSGAVAENSSDFKEAKADIQESDLAVDTSFTADEIAAVKVATTPSLEDYKIIRTVDVIATECVFGMNMYKDLVVGLSDLVGGRSKTMQKALRDARLNCLSELKLEALRSGANAVVGVTFNHNEFTGKGSSMIFVVATGTAVVVQRKSEGMSSKGNG